ASPSLVLNSSEENGSIPLHPQPLNVIPLSWYIHVLALRYQAVIMLHHREERDDLINHTNDGVAFIGSTLLGKVGPLIGSADIAESEDAY
ncbi:alpha-crystallin domain-containing protein 22.3-like, partial [Capsicum annuum]|uniref:alpha-crystallin domain-containing protein 22.3-like n=1 Tax=Capsicum annuum TaxID=4072 RepID=UPI001FB0D1A2